MDHLADPRVSTWVDDAVDWNAIAGLLEASYRSVAIKRML
jgi:hypothetical protein